MIIEDFNSNYITNSSCHPEQFIFELAGSLTKNTKKAYLNDIKQFFNVDDFSQLALEQIKNVNVSTANQYFEKLALQGYEPSTINRKLQALSKFYKYLCRKEIGIMDYDPFSSEQGNLRLKNKSYSNTRALSDGEVKNFLNVLSDDKSIIGLRNKIIVLMLATTGIRREEAISISIGQITVTMGKSVIEITGKGRKERLIVIADTIKNMIDEYLTLRGLSYEDKDMPLFVNHSSNANNTAQSLKAGTVYKMVKKTAEKAGLDATDISPHSFRHTYITKSLEMGCRIEDVQDRAGHSDLGTTRRYDHTRRIINDNPAYEMVEIYCN